MPFGIALLRSPASPPSVAPIEASTEAHTSLRNATTLLATTKAKSSATLSAESASVAQHLLLKTPLQLIQLRKGKSVILKHKTI